MDRLARLPHLAHLDLSRNRVGDVGIARLGVLNRLRTLVLTGTDVGDDAVEDLTRVVPGLVIRR